MVFKTRIGSDLDWIFSDRIRILKFTTYRIMNFQSDPMHTSTPDHQARIIFWAKSSLPSPNFLRPYASDQENALKLDGPPNKKILSIRPCPWIPKPIST